MERLVIEVCVVIVVFVLGYWMGYRACFDYLMEELRNHMEDKNGKTL